MSNIQISIIVPFYNRIDLLEKTIDSVVQQTISNWELILVDDGSEEKISNTIQKFQTQENIRFLKRTRTPKGAPTCRNIGAENATSEHLIYLDSDDLLAPWCIESRIKTIEDSAEADLYIFEAIEFDNKAPETHRLRSIFNYQNPLEGFLSFQSIWQTSCVVWTKKLYNSIDGWDEKAKSWQDGEIHIRALLKRPKVQWGNTFPDIFIRKHDDENRISNQLSIDKLSRLYETYTNILHLLKDEPQLKRIFEENIESSLFTNVEGYSKSFLTEYAKWIEHHVSNPKLRRNIQQYIYLYQWFGFSAFSIRALYQLRKIGIPNKRKMFWSIRPKLTPEAKSKLISKINNHKFLLNEVKLK